MLIRGDLFDVLPTLAEASIDEQREFVGIERERVQ